MARENRTVASSAHLRARCACILMQGDNKRLIKRGSGVHLSELLLQPDLTTRNAIRQRANPFPVPFVLCNERGAKCALSQLLFDVDVRIGLI